MELARKLWVSACAAALGSMLAVSSIADSKPGSQAIARDEQLTGTVTAVDSKDRTFDVLTGVGYALRVRHLHMGAAAGIMARRAEVPLSRLAPGSIVRVACTTAGAVWTASTVEILEPPPAHGKP